MKTIEYAPEEMAIADAHCEKYARTFLALTGQEHLCVSCENFIHAVRALIAEGVVPHTEVEFIFNGEVLRPNADGSLNRWPAGFCDTADGFMSRLLAERVKPKG